jgi:PAS domain S-box-containing protein
MPPGRDGQLTQIKQDPLSDPLPSRRLLIFLLPIIAVGTFATGIAVIASLSGWYRDEMAMTALALGGTVMILVIILMVRERHDWNEARRSLENLVARVGGIVESAMDAIVTVDEQQRVVQFNAAAERVFLWPRGAVIGRPLSMLIPQRFHEAHAAHIERFGRTSVTSRSMGSQLVIFGVRANGDEFPIEASISQHVESGQRLFTVILRDVSQRVRSEAALARSESRLRSILDSAMDAIITIDENQHVVLFNTAAEEVFQCSREEAIGASLSWFIPERFRGAHAGHIQSFGKGGAASRRMSATRVVMGLRRNGEEFPIEASISQTAEGNERFFTVILRDVTERVRADDALKKSKEEIQHLAVAASAAREQEKRRIARELHDELGQALTALKMDVGSLRDAGVGADNAVARNTLESMQTLLDSTVAAARRISADLRPMMLDDLGLTAAADWLAQSFTDRTGVPCELVLDESADLDLPDPYATAIFRVLQESLTNVAKHAEATRVEATLERVDGEVVLTVQDNGKGMAPGAENKRGSFGLVGLRERAYLLGGHVHLDSKPGAGTLVEFRIPLAETGTGP